MTPRFSTVDDYIASFPPEVRARLDELRRTITEAVPDAVEAISYQIPTFKLHGKNLVHFAAWKHHVGVYPVHTVAGALERDLAPFRTSKATVRFPLDEPIPQALVTRLVEHLVQCRAR